MINKLDKNQLIQLALHTTGINTILLEALLTPPSVETEDGEKNVNVEVHVVTMDRDSEEEPDPFDLDAMCGEWKSVRKQPDLLIFKAAPGHLIALGKKPKKDETGECYLIHNVQGHLCFNAGKGNVYLAHDDEEDTIILYPGGRYTRVDEPRK